MKKLDPKIGEVLKAHGFDASACWDCHGTWVIYHRVLEQIAASAGIRFDPPQVVEADGGNKIAALCVVGNLGDKSEWSIGEAAPGNNKNAYPWAMAEKRAKDRVILKLIGLHGLAYSEDEADNFKDSAPVLDPDIADTITGEQVTQLNALADEVGADKAAFCKYLGVESLADIHPKQFQTAVDALERKRKAAA